MMTGGEKAAWIGTGVLGVATTGAAINWAVAARRFHACADQPETWLFECLGETLMWRFARRVFIVTSVLTAAAATTATVIHYRRRKR